MSEMGQSVPDASGYWVTPVLAAWVSRSARLRRAAYPCKSANARLDPSARVRVPIGDGADDSCESLQLRTGRHAKPIAGRSKSGARRRCFPWISDVRVFGALSAVAAGRLPLLIRPTTPS